MKHVVFTSDELDTQTFDSLYQLYKDGYQFTLIGNGTSEKFKEIFTSKLSLISNTKNKNMETVKNEVHVKQGTTGKALKAGKGVKKVTGKKAGNKKKAAAPKKVKAEGERKTPKRLTPDEVLKIRKHFEGVAKKDITPAVIAEQAGKYGILKRTLKKILANKNYLAAK